MHHLFCTKIILASAAYSSQRCYQVVMMIKKKNSAKIYKEHVDITVKFPLL